MKAAGIPFGETVISLYVDGSPEKIREHSPAGKVPILHDGDISVWELLAIIEYVAEDRGHTHPQGTEGDRGRP